MAVDTAARRFDMLNFAIPVWVTPLWVPGGVSVDVDDRPHLLNLYSGISLTSETVETIPTVAYWMIRMARRAGR